MVKNGQAVSTAIQSWGNEIETLYGCLPSASLWDKFICNLTFVQNTSETYNELRLTLLKDNFTSALPRPISFVFQLESALRNLYSFTEGQISAVGTFAHLYQAGDTTINVLASTPSSYSSLPWDAVQQPQRDKRCSQRLSLHRYDRGGYNCIQLCHLGIEQQPVGFANVLGSVQLPHKYLPVDSASVRFAERGFPSWRRSLASGRLDDRHRHTSTTVTYGQVATLTRRSMAKRGHSRTLLPVLVTRLL